MRTFSLSEATWMFRDATAGARWRVAKVPGCVHRDLLRHGAIPDPFWGCNEAKLQWIGEHRWEYWAGFAVTRDMLAEDVLDLVADGLDTFATVSINGHEVARTENMFRGYRWDVKRFLRAGRNEILIRFESAIDVISRERLEHHPFEYNDPVGRCSTVRKQQCQFGWDWGPRLVTAGIWRDIRLEAWSGNRLEDVRLTQFHEPDGSVRLVFEPELAAPDGAVKLRGRISLNGRDVVAIEDRETKIEHPELWWPNGHGAQPLYRVDLEAVDASGRVLGVWSRRIGLRTIVLDRHEDEWGESFQFVVNGRAVFAKGANWIPAHSFVGGLKRADYERDLASAAHAHMNMIRVWGGGVYEHEEFYDLCDELGLMVWQDFMFACTIFPGDAVFLENVRLEAEYQVRRLRHRACLALWCGNNEIVQLNTVGREQADLLRNDKLRRDYEAVFHGVLPEAVETCDGATSYWPTSPWRGSFETSAGTPTALAEGEKRGDTHYWDVWHARHPVKSYERWRFRFCSEFGMQSYSSTETNATFCPPHNDNIFGAEMENHQKNRAGNQIILDYVSQHYRFPKNQDALIYLSQLNQARCMQVGVEHWRRNMPRCMGALYWQLNDCWPAASWSSIEFTGRWRALHHVARRFFAPALVCAHVPGEETLTIGNYRQSTVREVHVYTVYDAPAETRGVVSWEVLHLDGRRLKSGRKSVRLRYGESVRQMTVDLSSWIARHTRDAIYVRIGLEIGGERVSEETVFLTAPRFLNLPEARTRAAIRMQGAKRAEIVFRSTAFQHRFSFGFSGVRFRCSDNFFELYPEEPKTVIVEFERAQTAARLKRLLTHESLADTY